MRDVDWRLRLIITHGKSRGAPSCFIVKRLTVIHILLCHGPKQRTFHIRGLLRSDTMCCSTREMASTC